MFSRGPPGSCLQLMLLVSTLMEGVLFIQKLFSVYLCVLLNKDIK